MRFRVSTFFVFTVAFSLGAPHLEAQASSAQAGKPAAVPAKPATGQTNAPVRKPPMEPYTGLWTGSAQGRIFVTLRLESRGDTVSGSLEHPRNIDIADDGNVKNFSDDFSKSFVQKAQLTGDGLLLTVAEDDDTHQIHQFSMQLTSENSATLKMLAMDMPPGLPKPRPWKLVKAESPQANR